MYDETVFAFIYDNFVDNEKKKISINIQIKLSVVVDLYHLDLGRMNTSNLYCNMNECKYTQWRSHGMFL